jgi:hypothetical protein
MCTNFVTNNEFSLFCLKYKQEGYVSFSGLQLLEFENNHVPINVMLSFEFLKTHVLVSVAWLFEFLNEPPVPVFNIFQVNVSSSSQNHRLQFFWGKIKTKEPQVAFI